MTYIFSKLFWVFLSPGNFLILLMLIGGFLGMSQGERARNLGRKLCFDVAFLLFFFGIFPVGDWLLVPLENRFPPQHPEHVDGIILLGDDESPRLSAARGQPVMLEGARRVIQFATLAHDYPQAKLIFTGGSALIPPEPKGANAEVVKEVLASLDVPVSRMIFEGQSRNTHENAVLGAELVHPMPNQKWLLVTSAYHMPRAIGSFRAAGWDVAAAPTDYKTGGSMSTELQFNLVQHLAEMSTAVHEYYGLLAYRILGYTDSLWPD